MKKFSLGLTAIILAISLAAFTKPKAPEKNAADLYWFNVPGSISNTNTLTSSDVSYLNAHQPSDPAPGDCGGGNKYCHAGFTQDQVTGSGMSITINGTQSPADFNSKP